MILMSPFPDVNVPEISFAQYVLEGVERYGEQVAYVDNTLGQTITFKNVHNKIAKCAVALRQEGIRHGDVVCICAPACIEFPIVLLAIQACGATVTTLNPAYGKGEVLQQFRISEPRMVFVARQALETIKTVLAEMDCVKKLVVIGESTKFATFDSFIADVDESDFQGCARVNAKDDVAMLYYSSGTTGVPKCVMLTHYNLVAIAISIKECIKSSAKDTCLYSDRPMFHSGGFMPTMGLAFGWKSILEREFDAERMLKAIALHRVTTAFIVPPILIDLLQHQNGAKYDLSSAESLLCGGAAVAPHLIQAIRERYNIPILEVYGMTECGIISAELPDKLDTRSSGFIAVNTQVKILDLESGCAMGPNKSGEILVKTPQTFKGYLKNPDATNSTLDPDGWLHTGDIGHYDEGGRLYVTDRLKEVIKYKTFQVPPAELEAVLLQHPKIADAGVIGIPDLYAGEIPMAFVVKSDESLRVDEVTAYVKDHLAEYKHLRGGVHFSSLIPKSVTGKIRRGELKKMAEALVS